ncbi:hypothetical protein KCU74_g115, partial [Aureobasidium melanogenum]
MIFGWLRRPLVATNRRKRTQAIKALRRTAALIRHFCGFPGCLLLHPLHTGILSVTRSTFFLFPLIRYARGHHVLTLCRAC